MIKRDYATKEQYARQVLTTVVQAEKEEVFHYLATTEGIANWFPQLSIEDEKDKKAIVFDLGNDTFEKMALLDYATNEHIAFEWASGKVEFHLEETAVGTKLTLTETLPSNFAALVQDFTGWYVQMKNVKSVVESGLSTEINKEEVQKIQSEVKEAFN